MILDHESVFVFRILKPFSNLLRVFDNVPMSVH
jgi:hypothetical protein